MSVSSIALALDGNSHPQSPQPTQGSGLTYSCNLDTTAFINTVNQWRAANGVAPLTSSSQLQTAAQNHINDMVKYQYYGHTNPQTKQGSQYFIDSSDSAAGYSGEVLDGPTSANQAITDFKNSTEHYQILTSSQYDYIGLVSVLHPENWAVYDNSGNLVSQAGQTTGNCLVVADLADKIGASTASSAQPVSQPTDSSTSAVQEELAATEQKIEKESEVCPALQQTSVSDAESDFTNASDEQQAYENSKPNFLMYPSSLTAINTYTESLNNTLEDEYNTLADNLTANNCIILFYRSLLPTL